MTPPAPHREPPIKRDTLVFEIPFPTTAHGEAWKDTLWIEYVTKAAMNAASAYSAGCGAIFNDAQVNIRHAHDKEQA